MTDSAATGFVPTKAKLLISAAVWMSTIVSVGKEIYSCFSKNKINYTWVYDAPETALRKRVQYTSDKNESPPDKFNKSLLAN